MWEEIKSCVHFLNKDKRILVEFYASSPPALSSTKDVMELGKLF